MSIEIGFTDELTNTRYAPLAVMSTLYQQEQALQALEQVTLAMKVRDFRPSDKLIQVLLSILGGCATLAEVNQKLRSETGLAQVWGWQRFADQSSLSRTLDELTQMNLEQLRQGSAAIYRRHSQVQQHDWRGFLWLDFDLTGLPCSPKAEASQKGYFADKKTPVDASWRASVRLHIAKRSGLNCFLATGTRSSASNPPSLPQKML
jgi:hypothetical protein